MSRPLFSEMARRFSVGLRERSMAPRALGPTTSFSMYVSGALSRFPWEPSATTEMAPGRP